MIGRIALAAALTALVAARALAQDDVDEMKKRYKNMPGGDIIAAQLEAHRAEIEAGMAKQRAAMHKQGLDRPAKSPRAILAMIPAPAKTVAQAKARLGKVDDGRGGKQDGDAKAGPALHEILTALNAQAQAQAMAGPGEAGVVNEGEGPAIKKLSEAARSLQQDEHDSGLAFMKAQQAAEQAHDKKLQDLAEAVHKKLSALECDDVGEGARLTKAQLAECDRIGSAYKADVLKQRGAFLTQLGAMAAQLRGKTAGWAARGEAIEAQARAVKSPALRMPVAMATSQERDALLQALMLLAGADNKAVLRGSEKMPPVF